MTPTSTRGMASSERKAASRALAIFLAVAVVCFAQVSWWIYYQIGQTEETARLRRVESDHEVFRVTAELNAHYGKFWEEIQQLVSDPEWKGAVPRTLRQDPRVTGIGQIPALRRTVETPFGRYYQPNWTWAIIGPNDTMYVSIDPETVPKILSGINSDFEFRGVAPVPGRTPWEYDPAPIKIKEVRSEAIEAERKRTVIMFVSEGAFFLVLMIFGVFVMYRTLRQSTDLGRRQHNFVAAVTHELKAPLASVKLYAETLARPEIGPDDRKTYLNRMQQDVARLEHLVDNTLMAGRLEEKGFHLELRPTNLSADMDHYVQGMKGYLDRHGFSLRTNIAPGLKAVTDHDAMRRVVESLIDNAVKYSGDRREAELKVALKGDHVVLSLTDHGVGIPHEEQNKVFNAFYRVGDEMTRTIKGTGLGLYLVREIVAAHGGEVAIASEGTGHGTTITVTLRSAA